MLHCFTQYILHCLHFTHNTVSKRAVCRPYRCERGGGVNIILYISGSHLWTCVYLLSKTLAIEARCLCFQPIPCAGLQHIEPRCCSPKTVSYEERDENHRERSPGGWWWVIKHFPAKTLQEPLCCSCSMRPSIVMRKDNTWGQHSSSLVLNEGIELQYALHIWPETLLFKHV